MEVLRLKGSQREPDDGCRFDTGSLDKLMPLHTIVAPPGRITHAGPTFAKLCGGDDHVGTNLFDFVEFRRPLGLQTWGELVAVAGKPLVMEMNTLPGHNLKAIAVVLTDASGLLINVGLGAGVHEIVAKIGLKIGDFSPADPTGEMLYMTEVQSVLLRESRDLNNRLNGAKTLAEEQAFTDSLTGLNNRRALRSFIVRLLDRGASAGFAVLQVDLDHFKTVNDTYGHAAGDHVLQEVSRVLMSETRSTDLVARVGGDEFVAVLSDYGTLLNLQEVAYRIISKLRKPIRFGPQHCNIGASIGATVSQEDTQQTVDDLLAESDRALYAAKDAGRGTFCLAEHSQVPE